MVKSEHNGDGFRYIVSYRRHDSSEAESVVHEVRDWRQSELVIDNQETFKEFEIFVKAANNEGEAPANQLDKKLGYSGEDSECCIRDVVVLFISVKNNYKEIG